MTAGISQGAVNLGETIVIEHSAPVLHHAAEFQMLVSANCVPPWDPFLKISVSNS